MNKIYHLDQATGSYYNLWIKLCTYNKIDDIDTKIRELEALYDCTGLFSGRVSRFKDSVNNLHKMVNASMELLAEEKGDMLTNDKTIKHDHDELAGDDAEG